MSKMNPANRAKGNDEIYTPDWCVKDMVNHFNPTGTILEPCKGLGAFTDVLPNADWCEIRLGKNFYDYKNRVDWIITNPPYSDIRKFVLHSMKLADNIVFLIPVWKAFNAYGLQLASREYGNIKEIRWYGTGGKLGFPMGNGIGAVYWKKGHTGDIKVSYY
ncbi:MAG: hypothetical protein ACMV1B_11615 [Prevotella sp.]